MFEQLKTFIVRALVLLPITGCSIGHKDYQKYLNMNIGESINNQNFSKPPDAGEFIRSNYLVGGEGLTEITILDTGILRYHFSRYEVLPIYNIKDYVGKCLIYYDVDPKTEIIVAWGFDEGGNPLSCRSWL